MAGTAVTAGVEAVRTANPYVGPTAFQPGDQLYGRDAARDQLVDVLVAERIVLLYSPSGAGKTSLLQAAVVGALRDAHFEVLPMIRVTHALSADAMPRTPTNRYVLGTLLSLDEGLPTELQRPVGELATMTLSDYLAQRPDLDGRPGNEVLIFDQFEEVLTADPTDEDAKREFFVELGALLRDRNHWAIFAMREDFLASLDPYLRHIPTRLRARYRLDLLTVAQALEAVQRPAARAGVPFAAEAAQRLIDDLRRVRVQRPTGMTEALGPHIEPVQLQVACHLLWSRLPPGAQEISDGEKSALGDVEEALAAYYAAQVAAAAARLGVQEALVREWFENQLITPQGLRGQVLDGPLNSEEADRRLLEELVATHLVRAESRRQATWYELAHDRFIEPIKRDNAAWRTRHLTPFERAAMLWDAERRPDQLLLLGPALRHAEADVAFRAVPLSPRELEFLLASRRAEERRRRDVRNATRMRRLVAGLSIACVAVLGSLVAAVVNRQDANFERDLSQVLLAISQNLGWDHQRGMSLASGLVSELEPHDVRRPVRDTLYRAVETSPVEVVLRGHDVPVLSAAVALDGSTVVTASDDTLRLWDRATGDPGPTVGTPDGDTAQYVDISPDGDTVVAGTAGGGLLVWDVVTGDVASWVDPDAEVWGVAMSPAGDRVASIGAGEHVRVWDLEGRPVSEMGVADTLAWGLAFSPDGALLATVSDAPDLVVWDAGSGREHARIPGGEPSWGVQFDLTGTQLATIAFDGTARVWDLDTGAELRALDDASRTFTSIDGDLSRVLSIAPDGIAVHDFGTGEVIARADAAGTRAGAGFDPVDPHAVVVLPEVGDPSIWRIEPVREPAVEVAVRDDRLFRALGIGTVTVEGPTELGERVLFTDDDGIGELAVSSDGGLVAVVTRDAHVRIWDAATGQSRFTLADREQTFADVDFALEDSVLVTADFGGTVTLWDVVTGERLRDLEVTGLETTAVNSLRASPDGATVVVTVDDTSDPDRAPVVALVLDATGSEPPVPLHLPAEDEDFLLARSQIIGTRGIAFSESGDRVAVVGPRQDVAVYEVASGDGLWRDSGVPVSALTFTPRGALLLAGDDHRVRLVDVDEDEVLREIPVDDTILDVGLTDDGEHISAHVADGSVTVLPLEDGDLIDLVQSRSTRALTSRECREFRLLSC